MTKIDQIKILDNKINANKAQYDLDRLNAIISAKSSSDLDKCKYLTGEDLGYKPDVVTQARFEYSPLGQVFNKGLDDKENKKEGLSRKLKNIKDENEEQLEEIKNKNQMLDEIKNHGEKQFNAIKDQENRFNTLKSIYESKN